MLSEIGLSENLDRTKYYERIYAEDNDFKDVQYYSWSFKCEAFYKQDMAQTWNYYLPILDPITYHSSNKAIAVNEEGSQKYRDVPSGYAIPRYNFLGYKLYHTTIYGHPRPATRFKWNRPNYNFDFYLEDQARSYNESLNLFNIDKNGRVDPKEYSQIGQYRNVLHDQLIRQSLLALKIDEKIADLLKIYYFETERSFAQQKLKCSSNDQLSKLDHDWNSFRAALSIFFKEKVQRGYSLKELEKEYYIMNGHQREFSERVDTNEQIFSEFHPLKLENNHHVPSELRDEIVNAFDIFLTDKEPIIDASLKIVRKIEPLESILEDFFMERKIKSLEEYVDSKQPKTHSGRHKENKKWILKTFYEELKKSGVVTQAVNETAVLYEIEFKSISPSTIRRYIKEDLENRKNS